MSFDHPQGLWLLALAVPIIAVHFYRGRIRRLPVPTLLFWEQLIVEEERKSALKKLRHYASLLFNLVALTVLTSAVASPNVKGVTRPPMKVALVIDTSPSMIAREKDGQTRLERAIDAAQVWLDALAPTDEAGLYDARGLREPLTRDRGRIRRGIRSLDVTPGVRAENMAATLRSTRPDLTVVLFDKHLGTSLENRAWHSGVLRRRPGDRFYTLLAEAAAPARIIVRFDGVVIDQRDAPAALVLPLDPSKYPGKQLERGGVIQVSFAESDAFPLDDTATFILPPVEPKPITVYSVGRPNPLLIAALKELEVDGLVYFGMKEFSKYAPMPGVAAIFDRCSPPEPVAPGAYLLIGAPGREVQKPVISNWDRRSPLTAYIDFTDLAIKSGHILEGDHVFLESVQGPLGVTRGRGGTAIAALGFSLDESDFVLNRAAFALFLRNWVVWIQTEGPRSFPFELGYGQTVSLLKPLWITEGTLQLRSSPGDRTIAIRDGRPVEPIRAMTPGVLRAAAGDRSEWVAVNFFDPVESDLTVENPEPPPQPPYIPWYHKIPYALIAALTVFGLLLLEWTLYHRGVI